MSIEVKCPQCDSTHHIHDRFAGGQVRCPRCQASVDIPKLAISLNASDLIESNVHTESKSLTKSTEPNTSSVSKGASAIPEVRVAISSPADNASRLGKQADSNIVLEDFDEEMPKRPKFHDEELDMTAMVDVTFLLLIFFMVTASFSLQKSIESPRQQTDAPSTSAQQTEVTDELDTVTVQINELGSFLVMAPDWERETPGKQNLIRALSEVMGDGRTAFKLAIEVHEAATLQALVDCMDAGAICGYGEVQVTQVDGFE